MTTIGLPFHHQLVIKWFLKEFKKLPSYSMDYLDEKISTKFITRGFSPAVASKQSLI